MHHQVYTDVVQNEGLLVKCQVSFACVYAEDVRSYGLDRKGQILLVYIMTRIEERR